MGKKEKPPKPGGPEPVKEQPKDKEKKAGLFGGKRSKKNNPTTAGPATTTLPHHPSKGQPNAQDVPGAGPEPAPAPKLTNKQIVAGTSWTGKLPVNLLSDHCAKMKWDKPDYASSRKQTDEEGNPLYSYHVTLSAKDPKTQQTVRLDPFLIRQDSLHLLQMPTPVEARNAAATYALFRVCNMQNMHMVLPPDYKAMWRSFQDIKKLDEQEERQGKEGKAWMYAADPFKALAERQAIKEKQAIKAQQAAKAQQAKAAAGISMHGKVVNKPKGWEKVPRVEMGRQTRAQLEALIRKGSKWNPLGIQMSWAAKDAIVKEFEKLQFRSSHVIEAVDYCKDREETLEWLLVHVPEDDLPKWALPDGYSAGVSLAATDLRKERIIETLAGTGYSKELCTSVLDECNMDEALAAEALQNILLAGEPSPKKASHGVDDFLDMGPPEELWHDEISSVEATTDPKNFSRLTQDVITVRISGVRNSGKGLHNVWFEIRRGPSYPRELILGLPTKELPSYIRLSVIRQAAEHMLTTLADETMKVDLLIHWVHDNINRIIENPGRLLDISSVSSAAAEAQPAAAVGVAKKQRATPRPPIKWVSNSASKHQWRARQAQPQQKEMLAKREQLPAWGVRKDILKTVRKNAVTIISGETGSGKSTQSVQFILDDLYEQGLGECANIIVTQPRRISALGLADRVAEERCSRVGGEVGYAIRGESRQSQDTRLTFVTTGILLRRLQTSGGRVEDVVAALHDVSHVVIDEVHERSLDTDFLLTLLREVLRNGKHVPKVILMSATLDSDTFKDYFQSEGLSVGTIEISGRTFPVEDYYLDDIVRMTGYMVEDTGSGFLDDEIVGKAIQNIGHRINYHLLSEAVKAIDYELSYEKKTGGILIFLPGVGEIGQACRALNDITSLHVLPLHASLETREQKKVFNRPPPGKRKVVVATNVAETSITIDDIVVVIDSGRVKETSYDPISKMRKLEETWASRAACKQRRGRAGRVSKGKCYKLFTHNVDMGMAERHEPEIRRVPLEQLCLSVRAMGLREVAQFLGRSPTPPEANAINEAMKLLRRMGALDGDELTSMGTQLAMIPADLRCSKLVVLGSLFSCLDDCVSIAALLSSKPIFRSPPDNRDAAKEARMAFCTDEGDPITDLNAFREWQNEMFHASNQRAVRTFCDDNFLSFNALNDVANTRRQLYSALTEIGIVPPEASKTLDEPSDPGLFNPKLLRALIAASFTPQVARIEYPKNKFADTSSGAMEIEPEARAIKYYTQESGRVFIHPSSTMFDSGSFIDNAAFMAYFNIVQTSNTFMRDLTPFNIYTLLLFSGPIELDTMGRGLVVDGWIKLAGWARIGVLVAKLRGLVDDLIGQQVQEPGTDVRGSEVTRMVMRLIELNGLDA